MQYLACNNIKKIHIAYADDSNSNLIEHPEIFN